MAPTKQVLRLQSDQILDDPQVGTQVRLKDLTAARAINLTWVEPAAADWDVQFKDPGANDAVVYESLAQTLANKTLTAPSISDFTNAQHDHSAATEGGTVDHASLGSPAAGDDHTQYALLAGRLGGQVIIGGSAANENLTLQSTSNATRGAVISLDDVFMFPGAEVVGLPATPSGATAAASKAYVDSAVAGGKTWKEVLLTATQLDSVNNGIANAGVIYLTGVAQIGDTLTVSDGGTAESWIFAGVAGPNQPAVGATALDSMTNLAQRINLDSAVWKALLISGTLQGINSSTGDVVVIYRATPAAVTNDRMYGTWTTPANVRIVDYGGELDYASSTSVSLPTADPLTANFGLGRIASGLVPNESHLVRAEDDAYTWNQDNTSWQLSGGAVVLATSGSGGGTVGQATYDSDLGLSVTAGVASVKVDGSSISFDGGGNLTVAGGAVPLGTSGSGGGLEGKVSADEDKGLIITGGPGNAVLETKVDGTSITYNLSGELAASGAPLAPTGLVSHGLLLTRDIPGVTAPSPAFISSDIPVLDFPDVFTTGQLFDFVVPADYDSGDIEILASYQMTLPFAGSIVLETSAKIVRASTGVVDTATFPATNSLLTVPASTSLTRDIIVSFPNPSGVNYQRGDTLQVYVKRLGSDASDSHTGSWRVAAFAYRYQGQVSTRLMESVAEVFDPVSGVPTPPAGFFSTDIPVIIFSDSVNQAASARFVVPDNWDSASDALMRMQYALDTAAAGTVRLNTSIKVADVTAGTVTIVPGANFDLTVSADLDPHRTPILRQVPASAMTAGSVVQLVITRDTTVGGNPAAGLQALNTTLSFGVTPVSGISVQTEYYLDDPTAGNIAGTVFADWIYPLFSGDFTQYWQMRSTAAAGVVHTAFAGRLASVQSTVDQVSVYIKGVDTGTAQYTVKVYVEGSGATPVATSGPTSPTGSAVQVVLQGTSFTAQPTGAKRFFVVVEATAMENGESVSTSKPFVKVS